MADTMRAVVLDAPGPVENLQIRDLPVPEPRPGWVRIKVMAFGLNRSELHTRLGYAQGVTFPRVLGIEAVGVVDAAPDGDLEPGQQVATLMGGMGRVFDGGYAEYTVVPRDQVVPFTSDLPWHVIGAVPETLQTAYGSLTTGLDLSEGQTLLVRGGTSSVGLAAITVAKDRKATVVATTRRPDRTQALLDHGADHVVVDDGEIAGQVRAAAGGRRGRGARARRHPDAARHAARHAGPRDGLLHRNAVQPVDGAGLLPHRLPPPRRPAHRLRRRQHGPAPEGAAGLPGPPRRRHRQPRTDQGAPARGHP